MTFLSRRSFCRISLWSGLALLGGCRTIDTADAPVSEESRLLAPMGGDEQIALEVFFVHVPLGDRELAESIWHDVDEQQFAVDQRRKLAQHGFRVGIAAGELPQAIRNIIAAKGTTSNASESESAESGDAQPLVSKQELRLRPSGKGEISPCPVQERLTLMTLDAGELSGKTLTAAQGRFIVHCRGDGDGRVRVSMTPQIQHGDIRRRFIVDDTGDNGVLRPEIGQAKLLFENLTIASVLSPGQMMVVGCMEEPLISLGRDFLTDRSTGKAVQKMLVVRLIESQYDDALARSMAE
jgi:hypothetical protein